MNNKIEVSPYGNMLVFKKNYSAEFVKKTIHEHRLNGLRIFDHLDRLDTLDFLQEYTFLEKLDIDCMDDHDYGFLNNLRHLKHLSIGISIKQLNTINLSNQQELETLGINWRKKIIGLQNCTKLSLLTLADFKEKDLQKIDNLTNLVELRIKTGAIESLQGVDKLTHLQKISISNCKKLTSIKDADGLQMLQHLEIDSCPKIQTYNTITDLPVLQNLKLIDCGNIDSIKFINNIPSLTDLSLIGNTVISDGDLLPAKRLKSIAHKHHQHYNIKIENAAYNANVKSNLQKIRNLFK